MRSRAAARYAMLPGRTTRTAGRRTASSFRAWEAVTFVRGSTGRGTKGNDLAMSGNRPTSNSDHKRNSVRAVAVIAAFFLGATFAVGSLLAAFLEADGFGAPGDDPRPVYLALLAAALVVSVVTPFVVLRYVYPAHGPKAWVGAAIAVVVAVALFGVSLTSGG